MPGTPRLRSSFGVNGLSIAISSACEVGLTTGLLLSGNHTRARHERSDQIVLPKEITECCRRTVAARVRALGTYQESAEDRIGALLLVTFSELGGADAEIRRQFFETMSNAAREMIAATVAANAAACDQPRERGALVRDIRGGTSR